MSSLERYEHLLEPHELAEAGPSITRDLPLELVDPNPRNPRQMLAEIDLLADNIMRFGLLQPVIVRRVGDRFELLGGHRRLAAVTLLRDTKDPLEPRWRVISAVVTTVDDLTAELMLISGQAHIVNWKPKEQATALERLALSGLTLRQIGERLNRTEAWASRRLRIYADSVLSGYVQSGQIMPGVAEELLPVLDADTRQALADRAAAEGWSQDRTRGEVRALRLDRLIVGIGKRANELLDLLSRIDVSRLPRKSMDDLMTLHRRIVALGRGPVIPSMEEARQAAGVSDKPKRSQRQNTTRAKRAGYKPRR